MCNADTDDEMKMELFGSCLNIGIDEDGFS